jgi:uncharacterized membrane protein
MEAKTKKGIIVSGIVLAIVGLAFYLKKKKNDSDNALSWDNMKKLAEEESKKEADFDPFGWEKFKKELDQQKK